MCVMHLMKVLFEVQSQEHQLYSESYGGFASENKEAQFLQRDLKIPSIKLFMKIGELFDLEYKKLLQTSH